MIVPLSKSVEFGTPDELFRYATEHYGPFDLDVCANPPATFPKCPQFYTPHDNALLQDWTQHRACWMNPPYGRGIGQWTKKAVETAIAGGYVVGLLPAHTDTGWFHRDVLQFAGGREDDFAQLQFLRGRVSFTFAGQQMGPARFPNVIVAWGRRPV